MKSKRLLLLLLCMALCAGIFAGCGSTPSANSSAPAQSASSRSAAPSQSQQQNADAGSGERPTVTFMGISYTTTPLTADGAEEALKFLEDYTNTNVEFTWVPNDSYKEKLGVTLMSADNMPMILTVPNLDATVLQAAKAGAFWDLNAFMFDAQKYPNLSQANENVNKLCTVDGMLIGIYRARPLGRNGFAYRKDWAEKLGLDTPKTLEDLYNMCYAFSKQDPDGNGKDDTYGIVMYKNNTSFTGPIEQVISWFGGGNVWIEKDGKLLPNHTTDEYMEALNWLKKMYDEGLVYKDWAVRDPNSMSDCVKNSECGIFISVLDDTRRVWDYFVNSDIPAVTGDGIASMQMVGTLAKDAGSQPSILATSGMNGMISITKAAKTEQDVINCLNFLDKMCDDDMRVFGDFGLEGREDGWDLVDGYITVNDPSIVAEVRAHHGLNQLIPYVPYKSPDPRIKLDERRAIEEEIKLDNEKYVVYNPAAGYLIGSKTYSVNGGNLDQILLDARTQYICGQLDEAGLKAAFQNWDNQGGLKVIEEVNELYQADK